MKGTSLETTKSQTQQDQLYPGLSNRVEEARKKREARSWLMANEGTPSMIEEVDDDMAPPRHVSKQTKVGHDEDGRSGVQTGLMQLPSPR